MSTSAQPESLNIKMNRKGYGLKEAIKGELYNHYHSELIEQIRAAGYTKQFGLLTIHLAKEFGFCYGVDRAVELAYETRRRFPDKKIFLTTEIIHNPGVNANLAAVGIQFLSGPYQSTTIDQVKENDVVIVPAFGTTISLLKELVQKKCELVDTTCASVIVVWKRVEKYLHDGFTVLVHGKRDHEETLATTSRVTEFANGKFLVILNEDDAEYVCNYIINGGNKEEFLKRFKGSYPTHFDPDVDLAKIGLANQTTMLSSESLAIAEKVRRALSQRYAGEDLFNHFRSFDTICNATQDRQDAVLALRDKKPDLVIVIGGYNSSNTSHLCEIAQTMAPTYHIDRPDCLVSPEEIHHKPFGQKTEITTKNWLKKGPLSIGITAGASTPNQVIGNVLDRLCQFSSF